MAVTLDFETYYGKDYSLSKMTTEQYIRDARFQIIGVGIKVNNEPTYWVSSDDIDVYKRQAQWSSLTGSNPCCKKFQSLMSLPCATP